MLADDIRFGALVSHEMAVFAVGLELAAC
jgi:hypothetical protein